MENLLTYLKTLLILMTFALHFVYIILILYQGEDFMTLYVALLHQQKYLSLENVL